ncbi:MAG: ABC transporter substrate-binding protein [Candidatus Parcubacteria bacterium]|nr:ABC transporter substrate-binding protein [Candidatus Parcubacteria bacterium]
MKNKLLIFSIIILLTAIIIAVLYLVQAKKTAAEPLQEITLGLSWMHQSQFTGEYYADLFNLYKNKGLKVNFIPGSIDIDPIDKLISGEYDFALIQPDSLIKTVSEGKKIKAIGVTYKIHPLVFASLPAKNIKKPEDLAGKTIGVAYSEEIPLLALLKKMNVPVESVKIVQRDYNYDKLYSGKFDVEAGWINEIEFEKLHGHEFNLIRPSDYNIVFYADLIVTSDQLIEQEPQLVEKFLSATLAGWQESIQDIKTNSQLVLNYDSALDPLYESAMLEYSLPLIHTGQSAIGLMDDTSWQQMYQTLIAQKIITNQFDIKKAYTNQFIK